MERWVAWVDQQHAVIRIPLFLLTITVLIPVFLSCLVISLILLILMVLYDIAWLLFSRPMRPGTVLSARWVILPCAIPGRILAVRKDMRKTFSCSKFGFVARFYRTMFRFNYDIPNIPDPPLYKRTAKKAGWNGASLSPIASILVARSYSDPVVAESLAASHIATYRIQRAWRKAITDPRYKLCRKRLKFEFAELESIRVGG
jgi:hypothetical protein